jgi:hypothetical protein
MAGSSQRITPLLPTLPAVRGDGIKGGAIIVFW